MRSNPSDITIACAIPGRTRVRIPGKLDQGDVDAVVRAVSQVPGTASITVDRRTGSVLCLHRPETSADEVLARVREALPARPEPPQGELPPAARAAQAMSDVFQQLNADLLRKTEGQLDLGMLATLTFVSAGALNVVLTRQLPVPPWFNLAWWGYRTFMTVEAEAIRRSRRSPQR